MENNSSLAVIVVLYNSVQELETLINSFNNKLGNIGKFYFIDNSPDGTALKNQIIIKEKIQNYFYRHYPQNIGSAGGFKEGMKKSYEDGYEWSWFLDQDGTVEPEDFLNLEKYLSEIKNNIICPQVVVNKETGKTLLRKRITDVWGRTEEVKSDKLEEIQLFGTHGVIIHREVINKTGYYDDVNFFVGWEDFDYSLRAVKSGVKIFLLPDVRVYHPDLTKKHGATERKKISSLIRPFLPIFIDYLDIIKNNQLQQKRFYKSVAGLAYIRAKYFRIPVVAVNFFTTIIIYFLYALTGCLKFNFRQVGNTVTIIKWFIKGTFKGIK